MADKELGGVAQSLAELETRLSEVADVSREILEHGIVMVGVTPRTPHALPMSWIDMGDEIVFQAGHNGGRWELAKSLDAVAWMKRVANAVVHGRVRETFGPKRSCVEVTMEDGTVETETGYTSLLPVPGWKRRGRTVQYASYFDPQTT